MSKFPSFLVGVVTGIMFVVWAQWWNSNGDLEGSYLIMQSHPWLINSKQLFCINRISLSMLFFCQLVTLGISGLITMKSKDDKEETSTSNTASNTDSEFPEFPEDIKDRQNKQIINELTRARRTILPHQMP